MSFSRPKARRPRRAVVKIVCLVLHGQSSNDQAPQKFKYFSPQFLGIRHTVLGAQVSSNAPQFGSASSLAKSQRRVARVTGRTTRSSTSGRRNHISREHQIAPSSEREREKDKDLLCHLISEMQSHVVKVRPSLQEREVQQEQTSRRLQKTE